MTQKVDKDCPVVSVTVWRHDAKSGACPHCAKMDGEFYVTIDDDEEPYEIEQHEYCRCKWVRSYAHGLLDETIEELKNQHADVARELDDAEAEIEFRRIDMENAKNDAERYKTEKEEQNNIAETCTNKANELIEEATRLGDSVDEISEELQDWIDELLLEAEAKLTEAEKAIEAADEATENYEEAKRLARWNEDEMDAAEKRAIIWKEELLKLEPCLSWPRIRDAVESIAGSRAHYMM